MCSGTATQELNDQLETKLITWKAFLTANTAPRLKLSKEFTAAAPELPQFAPQQTKSATEIEDFLATLRTPKNLKFNAGRIIHTDESKTDQNLAAGIYDSTTGTIQHIQILNQPKSMRSAIRAELK